MRRRVLGNHGNFYWKGRGGYLIDYILHYLTELQPTLWGSPHPWTGAVNGQPGEASINQSAERVLRTDVHTVWTLTQRHDLLKWLTVLVHKPEMLHCVALQHTGQKKRWRWEEDSVHELLHRRPGRLYHHFSRTWQRPKVGLAKAKCACLWGKFQRKIEASHHAHTQDQNRSGRWTCMPMAWISTHKPPLIAKSPKSAHEHDCRKFSKQRVPGRAIPLSIDLKLPHLSGEHSETGMPARARPMTCKDRSHSRGEIAVPDLHTEVTASLYYCTLYVTNDKLRRGGAIIIRIRRCSFCLYNVSFIYISIWTFFWVVF